MVWTQFQDKSALQAVISLYLNIMPVLNQCGCNSSGSDETNMYLKPLLKTADQLQ